MPTTHHNIVRNTATTKIENARRTRAKNTSERFALREMADNAVMANPSRPACTRLRSLAVVVALLATSAAVYASDAKDLDEVVVSAGRRPQSWLEIGASLSRIAADETGVVDLLHVADALNRAPGVYMQRGSGQESLLAIRSPVLTGAGACGAFLVMEDGFPIRPVGFCNVNEMFEINPSQAAAIEVLRGPGTAVMGANAVHGSVSVLTPAVGGIRNSAAAGARRVVDIKSMSQVDTDAVIADPVEDLRGRLREEHDAIVQEGKSEFRTSAGVDPPPSAREDFRGAGRPGLIVRDRDKDLLVVTVAQIQGRVGTREVVTGKCRGRRHDGGRNRCRCHQMSEISHEKASRSFHGRLQVTFLLLESCYLIPA